MKDNCEVSRPEWFGAISDSTYFFRDAMWLTYHSTPNCDYI